MTSEELLQAGIEAVRAGDLDRAASLFADLVKTDPSSDRGWYLLGMCVPDPARRAFCLRRALAINPGNGPARKQLDLLSPPAAAAPAEEPSAPPALPAAAHGSWSPLTPPYAPPPSPPLAPWEPPSPDSAVEEPQELAGAEPETTTEPPPTSAVAADGEEPTSSLPFTPPPWAEAAPWQGFKLTEETSEEPEQLQAAEEEPPVTSQPAFPSSRPEQAQLQADHPSAFGEADNAELRALYSETEPAGEEKPTFAYDDSPLQVFLAGLESGGSRPPAAQDAHPQGLPPTEAAKPAVAAQPVPKVAPQPAPQPAPAVAQRAVPQPTPARRPPTAVAKAPAKKKKASNAGTIALVVVSLLLLGLCAVAIGYLILTGRVAGLLTPASIQIPTALVLPTAAATQPAGSEAQAARADAAATATTAPTPLPTPLPTVAYTPTYEAAACRFEVPKGAHVTCGFLNVPEDRSGDPTHTIRLAVAVYHSTGSNPAAPVLFLQGGPGGAALQLAAEAYPILVQPFLSQRDFVAYDQRGTGLSEPTLECPDLTKAYLQDIYGQIPRDSRKIVYANAFLSCQGQMSVGGINLNAYTTTASAADVRDLMQVLNYKQVDLYGASYGTRLAQVVMRDDPGLVQAAVLDSVVPIETNSFAEYPDSIQGALKRLFDACATDPGCSAAYPDLESVFWDQVKRLDAKPVPLTVSDPRNGTITSDVDGSVFLNVILMSLKVSSLIDTAPQTIYRFKAGDYSTVIAAQSSLPYTFQGISLGLFISMMCHEQILETTPDQLQAAMAAPADIQEYAWLPFFGNAQDVYRSCQSWRATGPSLGENDPVNADIPTLIITGRFDPTTPPKYAQLVAAHLSHNYYFEFPNQGHTPTAADASGCAMDTVVAFLADPQVEPDRSCLNGLRPVSFILPYTGDPPAALRAVGPGGLAARVPSGWADVGEGFYLRENSPFDVTQIGIFPVPGTTSADLLKWLSQKAWGYRGLDTAPVWAGQRKANGLDWTLYTSTSLGRPADIAMADHNGSSIVVLAFSSIDEHDAFYRTIFLPVVDSVRP